MSDKPFKEFEFTSAQVATILSDWIHDNHGVRVEVPDIHFVCSDKAPTGYMLDRYLVHHLTHAVVTKDMDKVVSKY